MEEKEIKKEDKLLLTKKTLDEMAPGLIFAKGFSVDGPDGINLANTGVEFPWVAVRGQIGDWAIYAQNPNYVNSEDPQVVMVGYGGVWPEWKIAEEGDKVMNPDNIKKMVDCDDEALALYNY